MTPPRPLPREFYVPTADLVAPRLLGHWLLRRTAAGWCGGPIVETEAYLVGDPAAHSFGGRTPRNRPMWGPPGNAYVYFIYGNHYCVNAVCRPEDFPEAVLIRALEPQVGGEFMRVNRPVTQPFALTNGPGKLCAALAIDRTLDEVDLCAADSPLIIAENSTVADFLATRGPVVTTPRIGIRKAADLPLRYHLAASPWVSRRPPGRKPPASRA